MKKQKSLEKHTGKWAATQAASITQTYEAVCNMGRHWKTTQNYEICSEPGRGVSARAQTLSECSHGLQDPLEPLPPPKPFNKSEKKTHTHKKKKQKSVISLIIPISP